MSARAQIYGLMLLGITALLAILTAVCWYFSSVQNLALEQQRNQFLLQSLRKAAEDALATGMTPEHMPAMQAVIDREKASFPQLTAIDLFSPAGLILYSTDTGALGTQVPAEWLAHLHQPGSWSTTDPAQNQLGMRFESDLGRAAGGIALTLAPQGRARTLTQWQQMGLWVLIWTSLLASCGFLTWALTRWVRRSCFSPYEQITSILSQPLSAQPSAPTGSALQRQAFQAAQALEREYLETQHNMQKLKVLDHGQ